MCLDAVRTKSNRKTFAKNFVKGKLRCNRSDNDPPTAGPQTQKTHVFSVFALEN